MAKNLELGCLWNADDERAYAMSGKINFSKLDNETRELVFQSLRDGEDLKIVVFENSYRDQNPKAPAYNILKAKGAGAATDEARPLRAARTPTTDIPF